MANQTSVDEILAAAENPAFHRVAVARILLRQDLIDAHEALQEELSEAMRRDKLENVEDVAPVIATQLVELEREMEEAKVPFRFRKVGHKEWSDLMRAHAPTAAQLAEARNNKTTAPDHNPETFPVAAIAASCHEPKMTVEQARRLEAALDEVQFAELYGACLKVNIGAGDPKSPAAGVILRMSGASENTPVPEESPEASSLEG